MALYKHAEGDSRRAELITNYVVTPPFVILETIHSEILSFNSSLNIQDEDSIHIEGFDRRDNITKIHNKFSTGYNGYF